MEKKTVQGKAESPRWRREATLRDILDVLDEIDKLQTHPEEKAKLRQRVIDYGQHLSKEIFLGHRQVPDSDDNATIKEFNIRMKDSYKTKGESSYEEARQPAGYYDRKGKFVANPNEIPVDEPHGALNPRWHPIPLKEKKPPIYPPIIPPFTDTKENGGGAGGTGGTGGTGGAGGTGGRSGSGTTVIPPYTQTNGGGDVIPTKATSSTLQETTKDTPSEDSDKKRHRIWWIAPLILGTVGAATLKQCSSSEVAPVVTPDDNKDKIETVTATQTLTPADKDHLRYTVEKGQRMAAKQFGFGNDVDKGAKIYDQFVENIRQGKMPQIMKDLTEKYQMSKMVDDDLDLNLDHAEIAATTWLLMAESYPAIAPTIHQAMTTPEAETTSKENINLNKYLSMANMAAEKFDVDTRSNLVSTTDYGLYGATKKTGWAISFRKAQGDKKMYDGVAYRALHEGKDF